ncbi:MULTISPECIES: hypothetical protein [unclassified Terrabacter]|uniref:hypothetical protein n=1 Tax=unclassified Terrabacter TaxID=2630222 RepID=UPI000AE9D8CF|nr:MULTISPECIES: hypothetical protein [unclassified Terrabacter]
MTHTRPVRRLLATVAVVATIPLAAACGSSTQPPASGGGSAAASSSSAPSATTSAQGDAAYCAALESGQKELESMSSKLSDTAALAQGKAVLEKIEAAAPAEVKQEWGDLIAFVDAAASGDKSALTAATAKMDASSTTIEKHAKTTCNLDIS